MALLHTTSTGEPCALVSNIQHYTVHDGPGIRTAIFFTGCTMNCIWCSNPETIEPRQRLGVYAARCISKQKCGRCASSCPIGGSPLEYGENGALKAIRMVEACKTCLRCAEECPAKAIKLWGEKKTLPELMKRIRSDRSFYERSGGGVTLNGGEVMLQWEFAEMLLKECKKAGIGTCVETALHCPPEHVEAVMVYTDLVIADIKHMDSARHRAISGVGNEIALRNLVRIAEMGKRLVLRTPVVPGYNGDEQSIRDIAEFIRDKLRGRVVAWQLLQFRKLGTEKYASLMLDYPMKDYEPPERGEFERELARLAAIVKDEYGLLATPGTNRKLPL